MAWQIFRTRWKKKAYSDPYSKNIPVYNTIVTVNLSNARRGRSCASHYLCKANKIVALTYENAKERFAKHEHHESRPVFRKLSLIMAEVASYVSTHTHALLSNSDIVSFYSLPPNKYQDRVSGLVIWDSIWSASVVRLSSELLTWKQFATLRKFFLQKRSFEEPYTVFFKGLYTSWKIKYTKSPGKVNSKHFNSRVSIATVEQAYFMLRDIALHFT